MRPRPRNRSRERAVVIERFARQERARPQMRWFELAVMAALYAKERCNDNIDVAYQELIKALDRTGFLGSRILYLHPEVSPPYFWEQIRTKKSFPPRSRRVRSALGKRPRKKTRRWHRPNICEAREGGPLRNRRLGRMDFGRSA